MKKTVSLVISTVLLLTLSPAAFAGDPGSAAAAGSDVRRVRQVRPSGRWFRGPRDGSLAG